MRNFTKGLALVAALVFAAVAPAHAACTLDTQVAFHGLDSYFMNCPDLQPVAGYAYLISSPATVNSAGQGTACNDGSALTSFGSPCPPQAGVPGDGIVAVYYDWGAGNTGSVGCPNPAGAGTGVTPIAILVTANDGSSVLAIVHFNFDNGGFLVEYAHQLNAAGDAVEPLSCSQQNGPRLISNVSGPTTNTACVNVPLPTMACDCDPNTIGDLNGICAAGTPTPGVCPTLTRGRLYTRDAPCGTSPDQRTSTGWVLAPVSPDAGGSACNTFNKSTIAGNCTFVGLTGFLDGVETPILSWLRLAGPAASTDKIKIDHAAFAQGNLVVKFSSINEVDAVSFNIYAGSTKLGSIAAKGGSSAYDFVIGRGAVKSNKTVSVEMVKKDGSVERVGPVSVK